MKTDKGGYTTSPPPTVYDGSAISNKYAILAKTAVVSSYFISNDIEVIQILGVARGKARFSILNLASGTTSCWKIDDLNVLGTYKLQLNMVFFTRKNTFQEGSLKVIGNTLKAHPSSASLNV